MQLFSISFFLSDYVRNSDNVCIPKKSCPSNGCNEGEVWNDCGSVDNCEASCKNPDLNDVVCAEVCIAKCVCQEGYVRDANWKCVSKDSCSAGIKIFLKNCNLWNLSSL
jgi:Trypsin Inhibitor like cysteine rich domain